MKTKTICSIAISLLMVASLTACAGSRQADPVREVSKEAGTLGSRICFTNGTNMNITATPTGEGIESNVVGSTGVVPTYDELCFAGRNSMRIAQKEGNPVKGGTSMVLNLVDIAVAVTIDGNPNTLFFSAFNHAFKAPNVKWINKQESNSFWDVATLSVGENVSTSSGGYAFTVTRRDDSNNYKEFVVKFTQ